MENRSGNLQFPRPGLPAAVALAGALLAGNGCAVLMDGVYESDAARQSAGELYNQALDKYQARKYAEARPLFQQYIGQYPESPLAKVSLYYLGHCEQMTGNFREAEMFYSRLVDAYGDDDFWGAQAMKRLKQIKENHESSPQGNDREPEAVRPGNVGGPAR